jgi:hypothetical protein
MKSVRRTIYQKRYYLFTLLVVFALMQIMTSFSFPDLFSMNYISYWVSEGHSNIYSLSFKLKEECQWVSTLYYPPLYYLSNSTYLTIINKLGFLNDNLFTVNPCPVWSLLLNRSFLFWIKLPYLVIHVASAIIFSTFFTSRKRLWFLFWLTNPVAVFVTFIQGQYDILPAFFVLLAVFSMKKDNLYATALFLGVGAAFKHYPFLLIIPLTILAGNKWTQKAKFLLLFLIPYAITIFPFIESPALLNLQFSENTAMLSQGLSFGNHTVSFYILSYVLLSLKLIFENNNKNWIFIVKTMLTFSLLYFLFTFWFVQRLVFLLPLLLLLSAKSNKVLKSVHLLNLSYFAYVLFLFPGLFDQALLRPLISHVNAEITPLLKLSLLLAVDSNTVQNIVHSTVTALLLWIGYLSLTERFQRSIRIKFRHILINILSIGLYIFIVFYFAVFT